MTTFDIHNPEDWTFVLTGEVLQFEAPTGRRSVVLDVNATAPVSVFVADNADMENRVLVGHDTGLFRCKFTTREAAYVEFRSEKGATIFINGQAMPHALVATTTESFTTVRPRQQRNQEFDRMMMLMQYNEKRRDQRLQQEMADLRSQFPSVEAKTETSEVTEEAPAPKPTPKKAPAKPVSETAQDETDAEGGAE